MITKRIFNDRLATALINRGFKLVATEKNKYKKGEIIFKFEYTEELIKAMLEINNK